MNYRTISERGRKMKKAWPRISVFLATYNHEEYVRKALDSILEQEIDEPFQILVADDSSTDNTQHIIREYMKNYPNRIWAVLRKKNIGAKRNIYQLMKECKSQYIAFLEGDDYWCDKSKLHKQVKFLDENPDYIGCTHRFNVVDRQGVAYQDRDFQVQFIDGNVYTLDDYEKGKLASHLNTLVYRNIWKEREDGFYSFWYKFENMAGDATINLILSIYGKIYCMDEVMSCYRKVIDADSSSFSAMQNLQNKRDRLFKCQLQMEQIAEEIFNKKVSFHQRKKDIFASAVFKWYREANLNNFKVVIKIIFLSRQPLRYICYTIYLLTAKIISNKIYGEDRRIKF